MGKNRYKVNCENYTDCAVEAPVLIEAATRYLNTADYPDVDVLCAILGIEKEVLCDDIV